MQMASVSAVVYRTQDTFRKLTQKKDWQLDVPRWRPAVQVDEVSDDDVQEREETALKLLEKELGM